MKLHHIIFAIATVLGFAAGVFPAAAQPSNAVTTPPVYVPDISHANEPLPDGIIVWDAEQKTVDASNDQDFARFTFSFTNVSPGIVAILSGRGSCSCTTVQLPPTPWLIPAGGTGQIEADINLAVAGRTGIIFKQAIISTDKGTKNLLLRANIQPPVPVNMTADQLAAGIAAAKVDRQAVFKGDCAACHMKNIEGKNGVDLFKATCAICHEAEHRATMVPDLGKLTVPTNEEFWRTWITIGKPGTLMPAFATSQGGPLNEMQVASLAAYLNYIHPSQVPVPPATNAPTSK